MTIAPERLPALPDLPEWVLKLKRAQLLALAEHTEPMYRPMLLERLEDLPPEPWEPEPHQLPPAWDDDWFGWVLIAGRGAGKTAAVTHVMNAHAEGPPCLSGKVPHRMGIIAPTLGDASASIVHGDDGLVVINPAVREVTAKGGTQVRWPNGAIAFLFGVHTVNDVDRLRAKGNRCFDLREEVAAWRYLRDGMQQADLGLRKGRARWIGATTPRARPTIRRLVEDPLIVVTSATTDANPHLLASTRARLHEQFDNTRIGLQELEGVILEDVSGALWHQELIDQHRVTVDEVPTLVRIRVAVDPSWGTTNDECGIVVVGLGVNRHVYVLEDLSKRTTPEEWGKLAALGYLPHRLPDGRWRDHEGRARKTIRDVPPKEWFGRRSERILGERNFQGEQVRLVMKLVSRELDRRLQFELVPASQGKRLRAEPVHLLYEQGKVHHVGHFPALEFQMTSWVPPAPNDRGDAADFGDPAPAPMDAEGEEIPSEWSPDRLDAVVFGVTNLLLGSSAGTAKIEVADGRIPRQKPPQPGQGPSGGSGPRIGRIPTATRQGRLLADQLKGKRTGPG